MKSRFSLRSFRSHRLYTGEHCNFSKPHSLLKGGRGAWNFSKSHGHPRNILESFPSPNFRGGKLKGGKLLHVTHIFLHVTHIFLHIFRIFSTYFSYFPRISLYLYFFHLFLHIFHIFFHIFLHTLRQIEKWGEETYVPWNNPRKFRGNRAYKT